MADELFQMKCYSSFITYSVLSTMRPAANARTRFFEAKVKNDQPNYLGPLNVRTVQELGLKGKPYARVGFEVEGTVIYAKERTTPRGLNTAWQAIDRSQRRKSAAEAALQRLEIRVNQLPSAAITTNVIARRDKVRTQITKYSCVFAQDLQLLFDSVYEAEKAHADKLKADAAKLQSNAAVKVAAQLVMNDAVDLITNLPWLAQAPSFRNEAVRKFQSFVEQSADPLNTDPPDYDMARAFAAQWADARPNATLGDPLARHLVDSFVKLVMQGCGMNARPADEQPLLKYKWVDEKTLSRPGKQFGNPVPLGKGGNASAHVYGSGPDTVVVKKLNDGDQALVEAQAHAKAKKGESNHIVNLLGTATDPDGGLMLVLQHAPKGDAMSIQQRIQSRLREKILDEEAAHHAFMTMLADMVKGVVQAHRNGVMHLDLKPENYFVDENGRLLLGDFGASREGLVQRMKSPVDSPDFSAPELVNSVVTKKEGLFTYKADIWSLGVILYEFNSPRFAVSEPGTEPRRLRPFPYGDFTFEAQNLIEKFSNARKTDRFAQLELSQGEDLHRLIMQMLHPDPLKRPSAEEVLAHPLIAPYANPSTDEEWEIVRGARDLILESQGNQFAH